GAPPRAGTGRPLGDMPGRTDGGGARPRPRFRGALRPGPAPAELAEFGQALGMPLPEQLGTLLAWHNGQNPDVPGAFVEDWRLMSTAEIAAAKKQLDAESPPGWNKAWVPFLDDGNGNYVVLDTSELGMPVREGWRGREGAEGVAPSLAAWVADFVTALEGGSYHEDMERGGFHRK